MRRGLAGSRRGVGDLLEFQGVRTAEGMNPDGPHAATGLDFAWTSLLRMRSSSRIIRRSLAMETPPAPDIRP